MIHQRRRRVSDCLQQEGTGHVEVSEAHESNMIQTVLQQLVHSCISICLKHLVVQHQQKKKTHFTVFYLFSFDLLKIQITSAQCRHTL